MDPPPAAIKGLLWTGGMPALMLPGTTMHGKAMAKGAFAAVGRGLDRLRRWSGLLRDPDARETARLRLLPPRGLFQPFGNTRPDRYPVTFGFVRTQLAEGGRPRLLSFGCSSGDEVFTLRRMFPEAEVVGLDISRRRLATARRRLAADGGDSMVSFIRAAGCAGLPAESFDAAFAMAVFRSGALVNDPPRCDRFISFAAFEREVGELARRLRPGGLLVLRHGNFRLADTEAAPHFRCLLRRPRHPNTPLYGRDNRLLPPQEDEEVVFRKI